MSVDITPVTDSYNQYQHHVIMQCIDDAVIADTDSKRIRQTFQRFYTMRSWIIGETFNGVFNSFLDHLRQLEQLLSRRVRDDNRIPHILHILFLYSM
jgi:hypothetical protein